MFTRPSLYRRGLSGFIFVIALSAFAFGADDYATWAYSAKIYLNTSASGASISATMKNFPVLVRLTMNNFPFSQSLTGGADIRFANSAGTHLPYQIERWVDNRAADIWVKVDQILGNNAGQYVMMYWGKTGSIDSSKGSAVFDTANGFKGVWHMGENTAPVLDATIDKYNGAKGGNMSPTTGVIGDAQVFNGSSDYADMGNVLNPGTSSFTVSAWVKRGAIGLQTIIAKTNGDNPSATYGWIFTFDGGDYLRAFVASGGAGWGDDATFNVSSNTALTDLTSWHHIAAVIDRSGNGNCKMYIDGVDKTGPASGNITGVGAVTNALNFRLATQSNSQLYLNGAMDEAVVSYRACTADWIKLCYQNQKPNQSFVTVVENLSTWAHSQQFKINTTSSGAGITNPVYNFPLLIRLTAASFPNFSQTAANGADIRFANANGMSLSYQIERWDAANSSAEIWVKVDTVKGNDNTQYITMYWGKTGAVNMGRASMVFDTANGFTGVWHLTGVNNSTYNSLNATAYGVTDTVGVIGTAKKFAGSNPDYMQVTGLEGSPAAVTLSCWAKLDSIDMANRTSDLVSIGDNAIIRLVSNPDGTRDSMNGVYHFSGGWNVTQAPGASNPIKKAGWKYLTGVFNPSGSTEITYLDGVPVASSTFNQPIEYTGAGTNTFFGKHGSGNDYDFGGVLDEVRIEKTPRSADWIRLCYQNQRTGSSVVCSGSPSITSQPSDAQVKSGDSVLFSVVAYGTNPAYQWQRGINGANWSNVTVGIGATSSIYKFKTDSTVDLNAQFRCIVTACGSVPSSAAKLTFVGCTGGTPDITTQPSDALVKAGDTASFTVTASGTPLTYQWQRSIDKGSTWTTIAGVGATASTYKFKTDSAADAGAQFHCIVTLCGAKTSSNAQLVFCGIKTQPSNAVGVKVGDSASFTVAVTGTAPAYKWQRLRSGGAWTDLAGQVAAVCKTKIDSVDTNSLYRCAVTTGCGSYTSAAVGVIVCFPIAIATQPSDQIGIAVGQVATFQVKASGYHLSYQWQRSADGGTTWSSAAGTGTTNSTYSFTVAATDNNAKYRCRVADTCTTLPSTAATLTVCSAPVVTLQPASNVSVVESRTASFRIVATGTNLAYQWQRMNSGSTAWASLTGATDTVYSFTAKLSDNGAKFRCVVTGKCGTEPSTEALLAVNEQVVAKFNMTIDGKIDSIGAGPLTVRFNADSTRGAAALWIWSYGDGNKDSTTSAAVARNHPYDTGVYIVKLVVQGPGGVDSMSRKLTIYSLNGNPIIISGRFIAADSVQLDFVRFSSLNAAPQAPPTVDSIRLWYQPGGLPETGNAKPLKRYLLSTFKAGGGNVYTDRVKVDMQGTLFDTCGFMTQILWDGDSVTKFASFNGCLVPRERVRPKNKLKVTGIYKQPDTMAFYFDSVQTIDTVADSVGLWYGIGGDSIPDFTSRTNPNRQWWSAAAIKAAPGNWFPFIKKSSQFDVDRNDLHFAVVIKSRTTVFSDTVKDKTPVGRKRPDNPIVLRAALDTTASSSTILLTWNAIPAADSVEKIRIYWRTGSPVPLQYDFTGIPMAGSVVLGPLVVSYTVSLLEEKTRYYFGAQAFIKGMWTAVDSGSIATESTDAAAVSSIDNTLKVTAAVFDSDKNLINVSWKLDTNQRTRLSDTLFIGYSYSTIGGDPRATKVSKKDSVKTLAGSTTLDLGDSLVFGTDYYIYLWLQKVGEQWTDPTDSSTGIVPIPLFLWQTVHYKFTTKAHGDTTLWANGQVRFVTPMVPESQTGASFTGTIRAFNDAVTGFAGFIKVGQCFIFSDRVASGMFEIGIKSSLPDSLKATFIYEFDAFSGKWTIDLNTRRDTVNGFVYILTNQLDRPFAALVDTQPPLVTVINGNSGAVNKGENVDYLIAVSDNVGNLNWKFMCAKGGEPFSRGNRKDEFLNNGIDTLELAIPGTFMGDDNGAVARFIADDGRFMITKDLSRQVIRLNDVRMTSEMKWVPMRVTTVLDAPQARQLLRFVDTTAKEPVYNDVYFRLFRRYPDVSNQGKPDRWLELTKAHDSIFDFKSGRLMWLKTRKSIMIDFGRGVTMPQSVPTTIPLFAHREFTDFALPYRYNIRIGDIIEATRAGDPYVDSLQFYAWESDSNGKFSSSGLYLRGIPGNHDSTQLLLSAPDKGFTVCNPTNRVVNLVIPPISELMSSYSGVSSKRTTGVDANRWAIQVLPRTADGSVLSSVYCGYTAIRSEGNIFYPVPPGFEGIGVCVVDEKSGISSGHKMANALHEGGCSYLLKFSNDSKPEQIINCVLGQAGAFPSSMKVATFNPQTRETIELLPGTDNISVTVDGESSRYLWLLIGNAQYISSAAHNHPGVKLALTSVYPNPVRRFAHLLYTLPFGQVGSVDFTVVNMLGKTLWQRTIKESSITGGRRDYVWYGTAMNGRRVAAGVYFLTMKARGPNGKILGVFNRRLTVLP